MKTRTRIRIPSPPFLLLTTLLVMIVTLNSQVGVILSLSSFAPLSSRIGGFNHDSDGYFDLHKRLSTRPFLYQQNNEEKDIDNYDLEEANEYEKEQPKQFSTWTTSTSTPTPTTATTTTTTAATTTTATIKVYRLNSDLAQRLRHKMSEMSNRRRPSHNNNEGNKMIIPPTTQVVPIDEKSNPVLRRYKNRHFGNGKHRLFKFRRIDPVQLRKKRKQFYRKQRELTTFLSKTSYFIKRLEHEADKYEREFKSHGKRFYSVVRRRLTQSYEKMRVDLCDSFAKQQSKMMRRHAPRGGRRRGARFAEKRVFERICNK